MRVLVAGATGASNTSAKTLLNWQPQFRSWLKGFETMYPDRPLTANGAGEPN
jgi:hypothetical protein